MVSYSGASISGSLGTVIKNLSSNHQATLDYTQSGGNGTPVATDETTLVAAATALSSSITAATYGLTIIVRDYQSLPNWPTTARPFSVPTPLDNLMAAYWRLNAIIATDEDAETFNPYQPSRYAYGWNTTYGSTPQDIVAGLKTLHGQLTSMRDTLANQIKDCT